MRKLTAEGLEAPRLAVFISLTGGRGVAVARRVVVFYFAIRVRLSWATAESKKKKLGHSSESCNEDLSCERAEPVA